MGRKFFGVNVAGILKRELGRGMSAPPFKGTLFKVTQGTEDPTASTAGAQPTETEHAFTGWMESYDDSLVDDTRIKQGDRLISILGDSIAGGVVPDQDDKITLEGTQWQIVQVDRDPLDAVYACQCRGRPS